VRVAVVQVQISLPVFHAAWNAFKVTAEVTVDTIVAATKGGLKINAFDDSKPSSRCCFF
jgi:hypothetical protein